MKIFDSANPLFTAVAAATAVSFVPNTQGTPVPQITLTGGAHIVPTLITAATRDVLQWGNTAGNNPLQYDHLDLTGVIATDSVIINGTTFSCVASGATGTQFNVGGTDAITATNLAAAFNTWAATGKGAWFQVNDPRVILSAKVQGTGTVSSSVTIEVSVNGVDGITHPGQTALAPSGTTTGFATGQAVDAYPFVRANVTALTGTAAAVQVYLHAEKYHG